MAVDARGMPEEREQMDTTMGSEDIHLMSSSTSILEQMGVEVGSLESKHVEVEADMPMSRTSSEAVEEREE